MIKLFNTITKTKEEFKPITQGLVKIYNCGPTVYDHQHIGNLYSSCFADFLRRMFEYMGYEVIQVMNITDVGHLSGDNDGDADQGEDRMEKGAKKAGLTILEVAEKFTKLFLEDIKKLNIQDPYARPKATEYIDQMIDMIKTLESKGYAYVTDEAVYFDVSKYSDYGKLSGQKLKDKILGAREEIYVDNKKRNPADFALWFKRVGRFQDHVMHWNSPWGDGFPGWHIECSAMSKDLLGEHFDIHTGGVEHIPIHHSNEIAQSECADSGNFVNYWMHHQLILVEGKKMSKSLGNVYLLSQLEEKGFNPLALRLLFLQSKYREQLNFTLQALEASQNSLNSLYTNVIILKESLQNKSIEAKKLDNSYQKEFEDAISDDLNTSVALAVLFRLLKDSNTSPEDKLSQILSFDQVLGLKLSEVKPKEKSEEYLKIEQEWQEAEVKNWELADSLRDKLKNMQ